MFKSRNLVLLVLAVGGLVACSTDRARNAGNVEGATCKRPGQTVSAAASDLACGKQNKTSVWLRVDVNTTPVKTCGLVGRTRSKGSGLQVCALVRAKARWLNVVTTEQAEVGQNSSTESNVDVQEGPTSVMPQSSETSTATTALQTSGNIANQPGIVDVNKDQATPTSLLAEGVTWNVPRSVMSSETQLTLPSVVSASGRVAKYRVVSAGTTGCSLDVESMKLQFGAAGECRLLAEVAPTASYLGERLEAGVTVIDACKLGISCRVGETGPGGGAVVYVATQPQTWGSFIEVAPKGWASNVRAATQNETDGSASTDPKMEWCTESAGKVFISNSTDVGRGEANTDAMVAANCHSATIVSDLVLNGQDDWNIPSIGDVEAICTYLKAGATRTACRATSDTLADALGFGATSTHYWSSSTSSQLSGLYASGRRFVSTVMTTFQAAQGTALWLRPVRYFGPRLQASVWVAPRLIDFGYPTTLQTFGGSGDGAVTFAVTDKGSANCSLKNGKIESTEVGTCTITATKAASGKYLATSSGPIVLTVRKSTPYIYLRAYFGYAGVFQDPIKLEVSTPPYIGAVTIAVTSQGGTGCTISGYELRAPAAGKCTVKASYAGDDHYLAGQSTPYDATFLQSCETGGDCYPGATGPGGGTIFYMTGPSTWFTDYRTGQGVRYLEVAPADWNTRTSAIWGCSNIQLTEADIKNPGGGGANTDQFLNQCVGGDNVFKLATAYRGGGKSDWYVPSAIELNELCKFARGQLVGNFWTSCTADGTLKPGFAPGVYWSSSQYGSTLAYAQLFGPSSLLSQLSAGTKTTLLKTQVGFVRPVRNYCAGWCPYFPTTTTAAP